MRRPAARIAHHSLGRDSPYRLMICDDSVTQRGLIARAFAAAPDVHIVASVSSGRQAVGALARHRPEVCILDLDMPVMDGLSTLPLLVEDAADLDVIAIGSTKPRDAALGAAALAAGAADFVIRPDRSDSTAIASFGAELLSKTRALARARRGRAGIALPACSGPGQVDDSVAAARQFVFRPVSPYLPQVIGIGASTGGPHALTMLLRDLRGAVTQPILVTQHMPRGFTAILAEHLCRTTATRVVEGADGMALEPGTTYLAPGDRHMGLADDSRPTLCIRDDAPVNFCRPAVDPMLRSLAGRFGPRVLAVILTGMGSDGLEGGRAVAAAGGTVLCQDEASSVIWGMPRAVALAGLASAVLPIGAMAPMIRRLAGSPS